MEIEHFKMLIILGNIVAIHKQVILCIGWYSIVVLFIYEHFVDIGVFLLVVGMWSYSV